MASRSYVPRHSLVPEPSTPGARRTATVLASSVGVAALATTAFAGAAQAKSAHHSVWDKVANCESGQRWHIATGNGYYGGLQFSSGTWAAKGGHRYAGQASGASRLEQIEVARRVLASQGPGAWPVCGPRGGLTKNTGRATGAHLPAVAGAKPAARHVARHRFAHSVGVKRPASHEHNGTHHKKRTPAKRRNHHHGTYRVRAGDTLSLIATRHHVHGGWHALYRANRNRLSNPNVLHVGQVLILP